MMPAERAMSIEHVVRELEDYEPFRKRRRGMVGGTDMSGQRRLSFEYIVFKNLNDSRQQALSASYHYKSYALPLLRPYQK